MYLHTINLPTEEQPGLPRAKLPTYLDQIYHHLAQAHDTYNIAIYASAATIDTTRNCMKIRGSGRQYISARGPIQLGALSTRATHLNDQATAHQGQSVTRTEVGGHRTGLPHSQRNTAVASCIAQVCSGRRGRANPALKQTKSKRRMSESNPTRPIHTEARPHFHQTSA